MEYDTIEFASYTDDTTPYTYGQSFDEVIEKLEIDMYALQPPSSSKRKVCNKPSIFGGGPMVAKIWDFRLFGKPGACIL